MRKLKGDRIKKVASHNPHNTRVLMIGPQPEGHGGVATAAKTLLTSPVLTHFCCITYITSWNWGKTWRKILIFAMALPRILFSLIFQGTDLVHLHMAHGASFYRKAICALLALLFRKPYLIHLHSGRLESSAQRHRTQERAVRFILDHASAILVLYEEARHPIEHMTQNSNIWILPNSVNSPDITLSCKLREEGTSSYQDEHVLHVLFMGDLVPEKGVFDLIEIIPQVIAYADNVKFIFCGRGAHESLKQRCKDLGVEDHAEFHGWVEGEEKLAEFLRADLFVLPSHQDELPMVILEAMMYGLPIISTRTGGIPHLVRDSINGFLISVGNRSELERAFSLLLHDPKLRYRMGKAGRRLVSQEFDQDCIAQKLVAVYTSVLHK